MDRKEAKEKALFAITSRAKLDLIDDIYNDFENRTCEGCKHNYKIENIDMETGEKLDDISPDECYMCSRNHQDKWESKDD